MPKIKQIYLCEKCHLDFPSIESTVLHEQECRFESPDPAYKLAERIVDNPGTPEQRALLVAVKEAYWVNVVDCDMEDISIGEGLNWEDDRDWKIDWLAYWISEGEKDV